MRHLIRTGRLPFSALNAAGDRLNHAVVLNVTAHTAIEEITEEPLLQGWEGDGQEVISLKRYEIGPTYSVHATSSESVFEGGYKCFENVAILGYVGTGVYQICTD